MKVAFHFQATHESIKGLYHLQPQEALYRALLDRTWTGNTKVAMGDLLIMSIADTMRNHGMDGAEARGLVVEQWLQSSEGHWSTLKVKRIIDIYPATIFTIALESIDKASATKVDKALNSAPYYLGAFELDESIPIVFDLYSRLIIEGRIVQRTFRVFAMTHSEEDRHTSRLSEFEQFDIFTRVEFEDQNGRHTIFDERENYEYARRLAETRQFIIDMLGSMGDSVVAAYGDAVPGFTDSLWSLLRTFNQAETEDGYAQVAATCRRIVERVADALQPTVPGNLKLQQSHVRNRLYEFVKRTASSPEDFKLIEREIEDLHQRLGAVANVANRSVHAKALRSEVRRCIIRTILALDDLATLSGGTLPMQIKTSTGETLARAFLDQLGKSESKDY